MKIIDRVMYFTYVICVTAAIAVFILSLAAGGYRLVTGEYFSVLYGCKADLFCYAVIGAIASAFLSNQIDKLIKRKKG